VYGGDGKSTFALPDLQGRAPMHPGQGPGLSLHDLGEQSGSDTVTLLDSEIPAHTHTLRANTDVATVQVATPDRSLARSQNATAYVSTANPAVALSPEALSIVGSDAPHNNLQPYLTLNFCIALQGVFPPRG
jgi:microcystin-dependent protein